MPVVRLPRALFSILVALLAVCGLDDRAETHEQFYVRFCFPDAAIADAFLERFGGMRFTYSPSKSGQRPSGPRLRYQRSYSPRIVGGKVMTPADLRRLHKYMLDIVTVISDEMRAVIEREWPELTHKLPPTKPQG
jgi:hypothetical protein